MKHIFSLLAIFLASLVAFSAHAAETTRPNVVFILIDDLSHYGVTAYGAKQIGFENRAFENIPFSTPNIDKLATEGLRCDNAFVYPLCEPSRTPLLTGKYNNRNLLQRKAQHVKAVKVLNEERMLITLNDVPTPMPQGQLSMENLTWYPDVEMKGNTIRQNRARSALITTKGKVLIEGNYFSSQMHGILIEGDNKPQREQRAKAARQAEQK